MRKFMFLTTLMILSSPLNAKGVAHLTFHMAAGAGDNFKIGTTIENKGDTDVYGGFVVLVPVDDKCTPLTPVLKTYGTLVPGEKTSLESEIEAKISGYRVAGLYAYDEFGYALSAVDETKELIESRKENDIKACSAVSERKKYKIVK